MDNEINKDINKEEVRETGPSAGISRHTWIGEENKIDDPDEMVWTDERANTETPIGGGIGGVRIVTTDVFRTRVVEKQKKPYKGFITEDELRSNEIFPRNARSRLNLDREELLQTRVYPGFPGITDETEADPEGKPATSPVITLSLSDRGTVRKLIAAGIIVLLLLAFEISYVCMRHGISALPGKTESVKAQSEEVLTENEELAEQAEEYGDYDQLKENKESWERLKEKIGQ